MNYELIIIGAGPAGISLAVEAVESGVHSNQILILEKANEHSFSIKKFYPENKAVTANYKGQDANCLGVMCMSDTSKSGLISILDKAIFHNDLMINYNETVSDVAVDEFGKFNVLTDKGSYNCNNCVVAIGVLGRPNKPSYTIPSSLRKNVHFDVTSNDISGERILVVGGGDSASEYCQYLIQKGNDVTLSYRQSEFSRMNSLNLESIIELESQGSLAIELNSNISSIREDEGIAVSFDDGSVKIVDHIFYALGGTTPENFLKTIGINFEGKNPVITHNYETNVKGLFLIGDLSAGKKGGSIISAFNSSHFAMKEILSRNSI